MVILDTNIVIDHLRRDTPETTFYQKLLRKYTRKSLSLSTITIQELYSGQSSTGKQSKALIQIISQLKTYSLITKIAKNAGLLMQKNHNLKFADAAIAATAIHYGASIATLNVKDFTGISGLKLFKL